MPGIENFAPERTETSSGLSVDPSVAPAAFSSFFRCSAISRSIGGRNLLLFLVVDVADLGGDREAGRHRQARVGHLGEAGAFAAEQVLHVAVAVGFAVAEEVHVLLRSCAGASPCFAAFFAICDESSAFHRSQTSGLSRNDRQFRLQPDAFFGCDFRDVRDAQNRRSRSAASSCQPRFREAPRSSAITSTSTKKRSTGGSSCASSRHRARDSRSRARACSIAGHRRSMTFASSACSAGSVSAVRKSSSVGRPIVSNSFVMFLTRLNSTASASKSADFAPPPAPRPA